jgi:DNA-binding CsgD family transcriptional regulator
MLFAEMAVCARALEPVGRDEELARIDAFLTGIGPAGAALVLEGEAGIGKTTLWLVGVERARECGFRVLVARPAEAERELSFATLGDLLADVHEEIRRLPPPQRRPLASALLLEEARGAPVEPRAVAVALLATLKAVAREQPLLVAVDDLQWVDASSALALSFALRRAADEPVAVLLARRIGPGTDSRVELDPSLAIERVVMGPLSLGAVRWLVEDRLEATFPRPTLRRIHARAGGNPFFALELARALAARGGRLSPQEDLAVSDDLERLVAARLRVLPTEMQEPLAAVAALGEPTRELVDERALEPAFAAGVLVLDGERVRFEHPLLAAAAYAGLTPTRRRALHRRLADLVDDAEERARHLALGAEGPDPALAAVLDDAALRARVRGAPEAAADLAEWALRLGGEDDPDAAARRTVAAAECRIVAGDRRQARALLDTALSSEPAGPARSRLLLHRARFGDEPFDTAIARLHEALGSASGDPALEVEIAAQLTFTITNARRITDAEPYARRCLDRAERVGDPVLLARALYALAQNQFWLGRGFPTRLMERALELDPFCESMSISVRPISQFAFLSLWAGDLDRARALLERARRIGYDRADNTVHAVLWYTATLEWFADEWPRALELANELCALGTEAEYEPVIATGLGGRAVIFAHLGDEEQTRRAVAEAVALDSRADSHAGMLRPLALSPLELSLERPRAALDHIRPATADARSKGIEEPAQFIGFPIHAEAAIACGELEEAEELLDWIEERAVRLDRAWALACLARCRGLLAAAHGDEAASVAAFERALTEHDRVQGRRFELARTLLAQGEALRRFKKKRAAREAIEGAIAIFDELGAKLWSAKARRELARVSGRKRANGLTETERRVAELVAAGHSNKEIASELFVTVRTVETHLTHVYAKLGVHSRTELVSRLSA